jgi:hypothetical protein
VAKQICKKCGYEGRGRRIGERKGGGIARVLGILTLLPFYSLWKLFGGGGKQCPHCQMPTMVKQNSDAGRLARRRIDIELGLIQVAKPEAPAKVESSTASAFGNERPAEKKETKRSIDPEQF